MHRNITLMGWLALLAYLLVSCSYNPLSGNNHTTGSPVGAISGAAVGGVSVAAFGGSKPLMGVAALAGGAIGYYSTTLRYDAGGIIQSGGQVYQVGQYIGINIPADKIFEPNTADMLPQATPILDSAVAVLQRYPSNNILISGNTSGFGHAQWEQSLSEKRAEKVSAYLWNAGINQFIEQGISTRRLNYVGYGDYFPIAQRDTNNGIRANSRVQITSYPSTCDLHLDGRHLALHNIGGADDEGNTKPEPCEKTGQCYQDERM